MIRHTQQIGGVTVTFAMGHVNELRGAGAVQPVAEPSGEVCKASPDWWFKIPSFGRDWPAGVLSPFHSSEIPHD